MKINMTKRTMRKTISIILVIGFITGSIAGVARAKLVACVGDHYTYGHGLGQQTTYPTQLEKFLQKSDPDWKTRNFGALAACMSSKGFAPYIYESEFNNALNCEPDIVIIGLGSFDFWVGEGEDFITDYSALIDSFATLPSQPAIWICTAPWFISSPYGHDINIIRDTINPLIREVGTLKNVPVIDWYALLEDKSHLLAANEFNWNIEGAKFIAEIVAAEILRAFWPPDFNGDSKVNMEDLVLLIEHWDQDDSSLDIAPRPIGDGVVNILDLEMLMSYWGQAPDDPTLVAHWTLDETEGMVVTDSAGDSNGYALGNPVWLPDGGQVDGALQLDGVDDYVITGIGPNPSDGPTSVLVWIKGGTPGQVAVSQSGGGSNWLLADPIEGNLMTELTSAGNSGSPMISQVNITDDEWHRIGFIWDGSNRTLYVDGVVVAKDTQDNLEGSNGGLYIGCGMLMQTGTYWSGLIDDVRIYNRPVKP